MPNMSTHHMEQARYTPQHIANYFLDRADKEGYGISMLKLIKMVYIAYGWNLAVFNTKLFDEEIEAWQYGPVIPSLYHEFKHWGRDCIEGRAELVDFFETDNFGLEFDREEPRIDRSDADTRLVLERVWATYKDISAGQLVSKTHEADSPWRKVYQAGKKGVTLEDETIREHFEAKIRSYLAGTA